jgi:hypothetical protein
MGGQVPIWDQNAVACLELPCESHGGSRQNTQAQKPEQKLGRSFLHGRKVVGLLHREQKRGSPRGLLLGGLRSTGDSFQAKCKIGCRNQF